MTLPLQQAIGVAKGQKALADKITRPEFRVTQQAVWWWLNKCNGRVPAEVCAAIEEETGVTCAALRPDIFAKPIKPARPSDQAAA